MAGKRLYSPSILIDSVQYQCMVQSVALEPGDWINYCEEEWTFTAEIELGYGATSSFNLLNALSNTIVDVVLLPELAATAATNPTATFQIRMPSVAFMTATSRGDRMTYSIEEQTEAVPVFTTA